MTVKTFAAIDVGSFELELGIFEISASAGIREIDHVRHALALGKDTYNDGRLSHEIVEEMCEVLNKFREALRPSLKKRADRSALRCRKELRLGQTG